MSVEAPSSIGAFRNHIIDSGYVLDPDGTHHEFVSGMHGQKLDFDNIDDKDPLYAEWVDVTGDFIRDQFPRLPEFIIGVANGTNRLSLDVARSFNGDLAGLVSKKDPNDSKKLRLNPYAGRIIAAVQPNLVVVVEDVGTTGSNSVQVAREARNRGARHVEVVTTWQRREQLERLEEAAIDYRAIIFEPLTTYTPEDCRTDANGFCARDWEFIERQK